VLGAASGEIKRYCVTSVNESASKLNLLLKSTDQQPLKTFYKYAACPVNAVLLNRSAIKRFKCFSNIAPYPRMNYVF
jgi:hypothetical protein